MITGELSQDLPFVTYVVVTRNRCNEVVGCLQNLKEQNYAHWEIVLVDDGSIDNTVLTVKDLFPEVRIVALDRHVGVSASRNRGVEVSGGEICIFLDDDARFVDNDATRLTVTYFLEDQRTACVAFRIENAFTGYSDRKVIPRFDKQEITEDSRCAYFCGGGFAVRRQVFLAVGGFWEPLTWGVEELDLSYRLLNLGLHLVYTVHVQVSHQEVPTARPRGQWVYFQARNRCWVAVRNLPWIFVLSTVFVWWAYTAWVGLKQKELKLFARGVRDALLGLPLALQNRQSIKESVITEVRMLSGRLWY